RPCAHRLIISHDRRRRRARWFTHVVSVLPAHARPLCVYRRDHPPIASIPNSKYGTRAYPREGRKHATFPPKRDNGGMCWWRLTDEEQSVSFDEVTRTIDQWVADGIVPGASI